MCYHARLVAREDFEEKAPSWFIKPLSIPGGKIRFCNEILWYILAIGMHARNICHHALPKYAVLYV